MLKIGRQGVDVLIFNFTGYPDYTSYFLADNGLAYLAGVLAERGHRPLIRDYVSLDTAERLFDPTTAPAVLRLRSAIRGEAVRDGAISAGMLAESRDVDAQVDEHNDRVAREIADELSRDVVARGVRLLAVKLWTQPSLRQMDTILRILKARHPDLHIVAGGGHVDYFQQRVLGRLGALDAAGFADGELALAGYADWLAGRVEDLSAVPNLIYRQDGEVRTTCTAENPGFRTGTTMPIFDREVYPAVAAPDQKMKTITFEDSRGCQFACGFCAHPIKSGGLRLRDVESTLDEIAYQNARHGFVNFSGSGSNTPFLHAKRLYDGFRGRGLDIAVNFFQSLRDFRVNKAEPLVSAHIPLLWVGVESADQDLLSDSYDKRRNMEQTKEVCQFLNENHIGYIMSLIYPSLGESERSRRNTIEFVREVGLGHVVVYPPLLQPRTPWMDSPDVTWIDREAFLDVTQLGLEEVENRVLPPMVTSEELNGSVLLNGKPYRDIYIENLRFRAELDEVCGGERGHQRDFDFTDQLAPFMSQLNKAFASIDASLSNGDFDIARQQMRRFNDLATAGSVRRTSELGAPPEAPARTPLLVMRTGGPA